MPFHRAHRRFAAWLAMCVMVFGALAPTVAQAMIAASEKGQWIEVCSASGMVWLRADSFETAAALAPEPDKSQADMGKHCPWCSVHGLVAGLPPAVLTVPPLARSAQGMLTLAAVAPFSHAPGSAQARAPPIAS